MYKRTYRTLQKWRNSKNMIF